MASLNKVQIIGNLGRDPETRYIPSGDVITSISVGCSESWKDKNSGEKKQKTEWIKVTFFGKLAEIAGQYLKKGASVYVEGTLRTTKYTDKDGIEKYSTDIRANSMQMLGGRHDTSSGEMNEGVNAPASPAPVQEKQVASQAKPTSNFSDMDDSDIPF